MIDTQKLPKIDLHLHLDGALQTQTIWELAKQGGISMPAASAQELVKHVQVSHDCRTLTDFLATFGVFYPVLQQPGAIARVGRELCEQQVRSNVCYSEFRFAPALLSPPEINDAQRLDWLLQEMDDLLGEIERSNTNNPEHEVRMIFCYMRGAGQREYEITTELILKVKQAFPDLLAGADIAGDESQFPAADIRPWLKRIQDIIPFTIHAGEAAGPDSVREALELGASRIGHGIRIAEDRSLYEQAIASGLPLEVCLTSNVQTGTVQSLEKHPFPAFLKDGATVTLNTDDPGVSGIDLAGEWQRAIDTYQLTPDQCMQILSNSMEAAFALKGRSRLEQKIRNYLYPNDKKPDSAL
jgi:adenosine deaminase